MHFNAPPVRRNIIILVNRNATTIFSLSKERALLSLSLFPSLLHLDPRDSANDAANTSNCTRGRSVRVRNSRRKTGAVAAACGMKISRPATAIPAKLIFSQMPGGKRERGGGRGGGDALPSFRAVDNMRKIKVAASANGCFAISHDGSECSPRVVETPPPSSLSLSLSLSLSVFVALWLLDPDV